MIIKKKSKKPDTAEEDVKAEENVPDETIPREEKQSQSADEIDIFDLDNIDFKQRHERRRGDRRRGFRRIDDRNLISRAREEAASIKEAAAKEGYEEGIKQAQNDIETLKNSLNVFLGAKQEVFEYIAPDLLEISVDIAQKIIKKEILEDPTIILENITELLKGLSKEETRITLRVNPDQTAFVKQQIPEIIETSGSEAKVNVLADENITYGGCMLTTTNGIIDATIETQISIISEALKDV